MSRKSDSGKGGAMPEPTDSKSNEALSTQASPKKAETTSQASVTIPKKPSPNIGHNSDDQTKKDMYVTSYKRHDKAEVEHFLEKAKVVEEARRELSEKMFEEFCKDVGLPRNSSMYRKAKAVAEAADRLLMLGDRLPEAKDTLYALATVEESVFREIAESSGRITAEQVRAARAPNPAKPEQCKFSVDATNLRHGERVALLHVLKEEANKIGATVTVPKSFRTGEVRP